MAFVSGTRYKQRGVIEFLVAEKESVGNIHKRLCAVYESCIADRSRVGRWVHKVKVSGSGESELHGYVNRKRADTGKACLPLFRAGD